METLEQDLLYLRTAVVPLEDYLLSNNTYWPLPELAGRREASAVTRLTLGGLLLSLARCSARPKTPGQQTEFDTLREKIGQVKSRWTSHWRQKAEMEFPQRLTLWQNFLADLDTRDKNSASDYRSEVRWRAMLQMLQEEAEHLPPGDAGRLAALDNRLSSLWRSDGFIWEEDLANAFPRDRFWFLYGRLAGAAS
jgi:hypothetical protein